MINFKNPDYLQHGNAKQKKAFSVIQKLQLMEILAPFHPIIVGTIPIEIDLPESDIDIVCETSDLRKFKLLLIEKFADFDSFTIKEKKIRNKPSIVAKFMFQSFIFELFGQNTPSDMQYAYRHMHVEYQILQQNSPSFRNRIVSLKKSGLTTEEAFAKLLGLKGDPYEALLHLNINTPEHE